MTSRRQIVLWSNCTYKHMTSLSGHAVFLHQRALSNDMKCTSHYTWGTHKCEEKNQFYYCHGND